MWFNPYWVPRVPFIAQPQKDPPPPKVELLGLPMMTFPEKARQKNKIRVMSFNILATCYASVFNENYCNPYDFRTDVRAGLIIRLMENHNPDIFCWQEVDANLLNYLEPVLRKRYKLMTHQRPAGREDGLVTGYKKSRFTESGRGILSFDDEAQKYDFTVKDINWYSRHNIAHMIKLQDNQPDEQGRFREINVFNVHTYWDPKSDFVKYFQVASLFNWVAAKTKPDEATLVMGDFNSPPETNSIKFLAKMAPDPSRIEHASDKDNIFAKTQEIYLKFNTPKFMGHSYTNAFESYKQLEELYFKQTEPKMILEPIPHQKLEVCKIMNQVAAGPDENSGKSDSASTNYSASSMMEEPIAKPQTGFPDFTNYTGNFKAVIDHIFFTPALGLTGLGKLPSLKDLEGYKSFPNKYFPSDHLPIVAEFDYMPAAPLVKH